MARRRCPSGDSTSLGELEDLRHLYAHNHAGDADDVYFDPKRPRHVLAPSDVMLTCGAAFNGRRAELNLSHPFDTTAPSRDACWLGCWHRCVRLVPS